RNALRRHKYVARLQVAVDHQIAVRVGDGRANLPEQRDPGIERQRRPYIGYRLTFDMLHHEVRQAVAAGAAIEQPRDVRVFEAREDPPLLKETADHLVGVHAALDQLERDRLFVYIILAHGKIHRSHAAAPENSCQAVGAYSLADDACADLRGQPLRFAL